MFLIHYTKMLVISHDACKLYNVSPILQCYSFDFEGTTLTNGELDEKINIQLNEHKQLLDEQQKEKVEKDHVEVEKLEQQKEYEELKRRERQKQMEREREEARRRYEEERGRYEEERRRDEEERQKLIELRQKEVLTSEQERNNIRHTVDIEDEENRFKEMKLSAEEEWELDLERERLEHLARLEEIEKLRELGGDRLLKKRQKQEENMFKKSVSFMGENERTKLDRPQSATTLRPHRGVTGKLIQPILVFPIYLFFHFNQI